MEMAWMDREAIMGLMEQMMAQLFKQVPATPKQGCRGGLQRGLCCLL